MPDAVSVEEIGTKIEKPGIRIEQKPFKSPDLPVAPKLEQKVEIGKPLKDSISTLSLPDKNPQIQEESKALIVASEQVCQIINQLIAETNIPIKGPEFVFVKSLLEKGYEIVKIQKELIQKKESLSKSSGYNQKNQKEYQEINEQKKQHQQEDEELQEQAKQVIAKCREELLQKIQVIQKQKGRFLGIPLRFNNREKLRLDSEINNLQSMIVLVDTIEAKTHLNGEQTDLLGSRSELNELGSIFKQLDQMEFRQKIEGNEVDGKRGFLENSNDGLRKDLTETIKDIQSGELEKLITEYQQLTAENDKWMNYINTELSPTLGIGKEDEKAWLETQPEEMREVGQRSLQNIRRLITNFVALLRREKGLDQQQIQDLISQEITRTRESVFVSVNLGYESALRFAQRGIMKPFLHLPAEDQIKRAMINSGEGFEGYGDRRKAVENKLKSETFPEGSVSGALASRNGRTEKRGGAPGYGDIFLVLNWDKVSRRCIFTFGDSMNRSGVADLAFGPTLIPRDESERVLERQLVFPHAVIAEGLLNILKGIDETRRKNSSYVEALIYGGFSIDEVIAVKIPGKTDLYRFSSSRQKIKNYEMVVGKLRKAFSDKLEIMEDE